MHPLEALCRREEGWLLALIRALVTCESPSDDRVALEACQALVVRALAEAGATVERLAGDPTADHVLGRWPGEGPPVLLLGHYDTVWRVGQLDRMPLHEAGGKLFGPGVFDMKAGLAIGLLAVRALVETIEVSGRPRVTFLITSDEEVGSHTSRPLIEALARVSAAVLVLEPALPHGAVKTARKGVGEFDLLTHGISSHAGANPGAGASAIHELARQITTLVGLNDPASGLSLNVGVIEGGTRSNVVAEDARARIDVRVARAADAARVDAAFAALVSTDPRVRLEVRGRINRPPMERTTGVAQLFGLAQAAARDLGHELAEGSTGGASDGNFTAALGVPTLDGLGAWGDGPHALHEHVVIKQLAPQAALVAGLLGRLGVMR
jgi:glutamate carboxypeptidase